MGFVKIPIKVKKKDGTFQVEEERIHTEDIFKYRKWHNNDDEDITLIEFKSTIIKNRDSNDVQEIKRKNMFAAMAVEELDKLLGTTVKA